MFSTVNSAIQRKMVEKEESSSKGSGKQWTKELFSDSKIRSWSINFPYNQVDNFRYACPGWLGVATFFPFFPFPNKKCFPSKKAFTYFKCWKQLLYVSNLIKELVNCLEMTVFFLWNEAFVPQGQFCSFCFVNCFHTLFQLRKLLTSVSWISSNKKMNCQPFIQFIMNTAGKNNKRKIKLIR